jgi:hypothetical protein
MIVNKNALTTIDPLSYTYLGTIVGLTYPQWMLPFNHFIQHLVYLGICVFFTFNHAREL